MEHATLMLAACQLGITVCSLLILNVSEPAIHHLLEVPLQLTGWSEEIVSTIAFVIALLIVSFLHVVLGEMVPKNLSFSLPDRAVLLLATPLVAVATVFRPIIVVLNGIANAVLRLFRVEPKSEANSVFTLDEVANIVAQSTREGVLTDAGGTLSAAFEFTSKKVQDIALPMESLVTLPEDATPADVERAVAQRGFSRYILVDEAGEPTGYLHVVDAQVIIAIYISRGPLDGAGGGGLYVYIGKGHALSRIGIRYAAADAHRLGHSAQCTKNKQAG